MKTRDVQIFSGHRFQVPSCIQRIDHRYTHGWQVRYGGTKMFSDHSNDGSGAAMAFQAAVRELIRRIQTLPPPSRLQAQPSRGKASELPVGISGPLLRRRLGTNTEYASLQVLLPRFGDKPLNRNVYIGSRSTYTVERFDAALARAVALRDAAEARYRRDEARARRAEAQELKQLLAGLRAAGTGKAAAPSSARSSTRTATQKVASKAPAKSSAKPSAKARVTRAR